MGWLGDRSGMSHSGKSMVFELKDSFGLPIPEESLYKAHHAEKYGTCSFRIIYNGCTDCGGCEGSVRLG